MTEITTKDLMSLFVHASPYPQVIFFTENKYSNLYSGTK